MTEATTASALVELAARCEAAEGPDRKLDLAVALAIRGQAINGVINVSARYTASIDAAMSLVPEGWGWLVSQPNAKALASGLLKKRTPVLGEVQYGYDRRHSVAAATPALALTAAALRARAATLQSQDHPNG